MSSSSSEQTLPSRSRRSSSSRSRQTSSQDSSTRSSSAHQRTGAAHSSSSQGACLRALNAECWDRWSEFKNCPIDFQMTKYIESKWVVSLSSYGPDTLHLNLVMGNYQVLVKHADREGRDCFKGLKAKDKITNNEYYCFILSESFMNYLISVFF